MTRQERSTGHWMRVEDYMGDTTPAWDCSECDAMVHKPTNFCPCCGAQMEGEGEGSWKVKLLPIKSVACFLGQWCIPPNLTPGLDNEAPPESECIAAWEEWFTQGNWQED